MADEDVSAAPPGMESLMQTLASSSLDASASLQRQEVLKQAESSIQQDVECLASLEGFDCGSDHAVRRVARLYCLALSHTQDETLLLRLCRDLCSVLAQTKSTSILDLCVLKLASLESSSVKNQLVDHFRTIAQEESLYIPALALASALDTQEQQRQWMELLVQKVLSTFSPQLSLAQSLLSRATQDDWDAVLGPTLALKLKANPERALECVLNIVQGLPPRTLDVTACLESDLLPTLTKQLKSNKPKTRCLAQSLLTSLAKLHPQALCIIAKSLAGTCTSLSQADQRQGIYTALRDMAMATSSVEDTSSVTSTVLSSLIASLAKETKATRDEGLLALCHWMVLAKRSGGGGGGGDGYQEAIAFLRMPLSKGNGSEVVGRIGPLLLNVHFDVMESIALDLYSSAKDKDALKRGLQSIVEACAKKHSASSGSSSSSIAPVEGLVVVFLDLLHAIASGGKLIPAIDKVLAGSSKGSFLYGRAMTDAVPTVPLVGQLLPRTIALYSKLLAKRDGSIPWMDSGTSGPAHALACCVTHPASAASWDHSPTQTILSLVQSVLTYSTTAAVADSLVGALTQHVNQCGLRYEQEERALSATREARESFVPMEPYRYATTTKGQYSATAAHRGVDSNAVLRVAQLLANHVSNPSSLAKALVLLHTGSSLKTAGKQRRKLIANTLELFKTVVLKRVEKGETAEQEVLDALSEEVSTYACRHALESDTSTERSISTMMHKSALSLISTLGGIACSFDPAFDDPNDEEMKPHVIARKLCTQRLAAKFAEQLQRSLVAVEALTEVDVDLYRVPMGVLVRQEAEETTGAAPTEKSHPPERKKAAGKSRRGKGDFGAGLEDEEWERQIRKELEQKKKKQASSSTSGSQGGTAYTAAEKELLARQDEERRRVARILDGDFSRTLNGIQTLCLSDIEVGNSSLPILSECVIRSAVSDCVALKEVSSLKTKVFESLTALSSCVFEIEEMHASSIARALTICCKKDNSGSPASAEENKKAKCQLDVVPFPSPCTPAAVAITEMDDFLDSLSGASFFFMLPIIRAALSGPRTTPGCEAALRVLGRHTAMLAGDDTDPVVLPLRKDMALSVLELLSHDRSQTFVDPSPTEVLVACYRSDATDVGPVLHTAEMAPLLDERGALGGKNCRIGSMMAVQSIAEIHLKLVRNNPLIENRVWLNCFDKTEDIQNAARSAWRSMTGDEGQCDDVASLVSPSPMYAAPLLPLLSHSDPSIASAAADAFAHAVGRHPSSAERSVIKLCDNFIDSYPTAFEQEARKQEARAQEADTPLPSKATSTPKPKKKPSTISTGLPKKKVVKKSALAVAGIGQPKARTTKKKITNSALLKPKEERTFDRELLESQFRSEKKTAAAEAEKDSPRKVEIRLGVLRTLSALTESSAQVELDLPTLKLLTGFLVAYGLADGVDRVRESARNALRDIVASKGDSDDAIAFLLPMFESVLRSGVADEGCLGDLATTKVPRDVSASDRRKEGVVVALGSVALHLKGDENEDKIDNTIDMLVSALKTPSESVQSSVASCLAKLMKKGHTPDRVEQMLSNLMKDCLYGDSLATRRGAAYGISAVVKGSGIASLKKFEIVKQLEAACSSGASNSKEGALFAVELLSMRLGLLFEPYVIVLLPSLLKAFSDSSDYVRSAADNTAGVIMSKLSAHGVKLILPAVLTAFNDPAWRTKQASILMLGSMSHCAPKQLASALPKVVPKVTEAFSDTHPKVRASAEEALNEISKVVKNPEISEISPILLKALTDPAEFTVKALEALIETEFLHAVDSPSLALIVPVLHRGLRDRAATTKRYSSLIAGNICTMINDPRDFVPYLPILLPDLKAAVLDPIPDVRSTSAKALGSLTRGLGEDALADLRPWLIEKLREDTRSSAERSGAAQGLTEVLIAGGEATVESVMINEILPLKGHPEASTREGVLWVLTFLPPALGQGFTPLIDSSLPALLGGLSDDSEPVRDVAMRAGRVLIRSHGKVHVDKILPSIEDGLTNEDYRIRVASLTLLGDLLSMIGGTTVVKGDGETQDDIRRAERAQAQIALVLGSDTRKRVLSSLYMARSDTAAVVRQSAVQVWKTVVSVTARTLRDILKVLVGQIVDALASGHPEKTQVAGRCLGDVVNKLGDSVLPEIIPVLRNALYTGDKHTRQGVCVGLSEVIRCSTKDQILRFIEIIVKVVQDALCDEIEGVREMAATCFQNLHSVVGNRAMDEIVPSLLVALERTDVEDTSRSRALNGLTGILSIRSRELLPYIIPRLTSRPISRSHAEALSRIATVTGSTIHTHFGSIIPALIAEMADLTRESDLSLEESEREAAIRDCARSLCRNVDEVGVNWMVGEIASKCNSDKYEIRKESCWMLEIVAEERKDKQDFYEQIPIMLRELLYRLNDENAEVLKAAHAALASLTKNVPAEELVKHIEFIRNLIASIVSDARRRKGGVGDGEFLLPGFNIPKGLEPLLPIYQRGILYGNATIREVSAAGLGELIAITSNKYLAGPLIIKITGPLLRIVGDRNPSAVKVAILGTLRLVLVKGGPALRAFVPQFQTTFVKALSDTSRQVRLEAIQALGVLMKLSTRVDPLLKELVSGSLGKSSGSGEPTGGVPAVQTATLEALSVVLKEGGSKAKLPDSILAALEASKELLRHEDEGVREGAAKVMGSACELAGAEAATDVIESCILTRKDGSADVRHGRACACRRILASSVGPEVGDAVNSEVTNLVLSYMNDDKNLVKEAACVAIGACIGSAPDPSVRLAHVEPAVLRIMLNKQEQMEVHCAIGRGLCLALHLIPSEDRVGFLSKALMDASLELAMSGAQRVQFAFNDVLWMALDVPSGEAGLEAYTGIANFDNAKAMKSLYTKVLSRIKNVNLD